MWTRTLSLVEKIHIEITMVVKVKQIIFKNDLMKMCF